MIEIDISKFYGWNLAFITSYDFLEQFIALGTLFVNDKLKVDTQGSVDHTPATGRGPKDLGDWDL